MEKTSKIVKLLEEFAPLQLACEWDNSGWQIYLGDLEIRKVMLSLSPTTDVINQAILNNCKLIISHHPLLFKKINKLSVKNHLSKAAIKAIQNNIQIYSAHTNLDATKNGIAHRLANLLGLTNLRPIEGEDTGIGRIGILDQEENLNRLIDKLKSTLNTDKLKLINPLDKQTIRSIAVCPGSGGDFIHQLKNIDLYITSDIKYHTALEVEDFAVIDAGHFETERIILPTIKELLKDLDIEILIAQEKSPWQII